MWWLIIGFVVGFVLGANGSCRRWRKNADVPYRIYNWNRLYKVSYADTGNVAKEFLRMKNAQE